MRIVVIYATTDGQTRKIARFCAGRLVDAGHSVELLPAAEAGAPDAAGHDGAILAGSVHLGTLQPELAAFARAAAPSLNAMPTLLLQVSLAAAGDDAADRTELDDIAARFCAATGWRPGAVHHVAGAFRFTRYDFFKSWAMRYIAARKGQKVTPGEDREYTDWEALGALMRDWAASIPA